MRTRTVAAVTAMLLFGALSLPLAASARVATPAEPVIVKSSTTSLTLDWPAVRGARSYEVSFANSPGKARKESAKDRRTGSSKALLRVAGLKPNKMYCFSVRAIGHGAKGNRSSAVCKKTMVRPITSRARRMSVATFNICGVAPKCPAWTADREDRLTDALVALKSDVLLVQETSGVTLEKKPRINALADRLAPFGYAWERTAKGNGPSNNRESIYYRKSVFDLLMWKRPQHDCREILGPPYNGSVETETWNKNHTYLYEERHYKYDWETETWRLYDYKCELNGKFDLYPDRGSFRLGGENTSAGWVKLRHRASGKKFMFMSVHLTAGNTAKSRRWRASQTANLLKLARKEAGSMPLIIGGDFNSSRNRADDTPRTKLERAGYFDAYDRSSTFSSPRLASYNGFKTTPNRSTKYGSHIDRIFVPNRLNVSGWRVYARTVNGTYAKPFVSDHNPIRVTVYLR